MAYMNGTFQYMDNSFLWERRDDRKMSMPIYDEGTVLQYLESKHPKWFTILQKAGRCHLLDTQYAHNTFTMFIPVEQSIQEDDVLDMDRNTAYRVINNHMLKGIYEKETLQTSRVQTLNTLTVGEPIFCTTFSDGTCVLNEGTTIVHPDIRVGDIIVHIISNMLSV